MSDDFTAGARGPRAGADGRNEDVPTSQADGVEAEAGGGGGGGGGGGERDLEGDGGQSSEELRQELDEQRDKYLRLAAEFDNFRKRTSRERQELVARAQGDLLRQLLDAVDDLGRAVAVDPERADAASILSGVEAVHTKLLRTLSNVGLEVVNPLDQPFNPELHEAVATERALSPEDDHLVGQVYQPGYVFQGQLLRPARVLVKQWAD